MQTLHETDSLLNVDANMCKSCGICMFECPLGLISLDEETKTPAIAPERESACLQCGHCVAICPNSALDHRHSSLAAAPEVQEEHIPDQTQVAQLLKSRRSVRVFKEQEVQNETFEKIIETASYAPTGHNVRGTEWVVVNNRQTLSEVKEGITRWLSRLVETRHELTKKFPVEQLLGAIQMGFDPVLRNAPALIIAQADQNVVHREQDVDIALTYFELAAMSHGLGTCWSFLITLALRLDPSLRELLQVDGAYHYAMIAGYPKFSYKRHPERTTPSISYR